MIIESTNNRIKIPYKLEILVLYIELYFASMNAGDIVKNKYMMIIISEANL